MLTIAAYPDDEDHPYGHGKAEYFSSGAEGALIIIAAISIVLTAVPKLLAPQPLEQVGVGLGVSLFASLINFLIARILLRASREHHSITLEANANHLMTDVWTSVGVVIGIGGVIVTGWNRLDPFIAILVGLNIIVSGFGIMKKSVAGLMDSIWPQEELDQFNRILEPYQKEGISWHALRTRQAGSGRFATIHILVPDDWTVLKGHQMLERIEGDVRRDMPRVLLTTHLEPLNDPTSHQDISLTRPAPTPPQDPPKSPQ